MDNQRFNYRSWNIMSSTKLGTFLFTVLLFVSVVPVSAHIQPTQASRVSSADRDYWPTDGWQFSTPQEQGMDNGTLSGMFDYIEENGINVDSLMVVKNGYVVLEEYFRSRYNENSTHLLYSDTKSFTSALVGIAIDKGYIDSVDELVLPFFPDYQIVNEDERRERMTIEDLLTMRSGMFWDESSAPFMSPANGIYHLINEDGVNYTLNLDMTSEPGTEFHYNTGASHLLAAIVQVTTGMTTLEFAEENLFGPIGIDRAYWYTDAAGWYRGGFDLAITTRSMAKFGYLYLNNGTWDGEQIISQDWVDTSTTSFTEFSSNSGYGYQWWTNDAVGMFAAKGLYGQYIFVIPEQDIVVAITSSRALGSYDPHESLVINYVLAAATNGEQDNIGEIVNIAIVLALVVPAVVLVTYYGLAIKRK